MRKDLIVSGMRPGRGGPGARPGVWVLVVNVKTLPASCCLGGMVLGEEKVVCERD